MAGRYVVIAVFATFVLLGLSSSVHASGSLTAPAIAVSPGTVNAGQNVTLTTIMSFTGGTAPYTCQWLELVPSATGYKNLTSSFPCTASSSYDATTNATKSGTWKFWLRVNDSSSLTATSAPVTLAVNTALSKPSVTPSAGKIDLGQTVTSVSVSWSGGTEPYTVTLYFSSTGPCAPSLQTEVGQAGQQFAGYTFLASTYASSKPKDFTFSTNSTYCATVTDTSGTPATTVSKAAGVVVNPDMVAPTIKAVAPQVDLKQNSTLSTVTLFSRGTSTYSCTWLAESPKATSFSKLGTSSVCTVSTPLTVSTGILTTVGTWSFELQVTDSSGGAPSSAIPASSPTILSSPVSVLVSGPLKAPKITIYPKIIEGGQSSTLTGVAAKWLTGGSSPYTCQWLVKAPGTTVFSDNGSAFTCTSTALTRSTGLLGIGSWSFKIQVTDSSGAPETTISSVVTVTARPALEAPTLSSSPPATDMGQSVSIKVAWIGGLPKYTISLYNGTSSSCGSSKPIATMSGKSTSSVVFKGLSAISVNTWYCATVTDGSKTPVALTSAAIEVVVDPKLVAGVITVAPKAVDIRQSSYLSITVSPSGGVPSYTCQWLQEAPGATHYSKLGKSFSCNNPSLPSESTGVLKKVGNWSFALETTDANRVAVISAPVIITVNPALVAPTIAASSTSVSSGGSSVLSTTTAFSGGTSTYACQWLVKAPGATSYSKLGTSSACTVSTPLTVSTGTLTAVGTWSFELQVTDSSGTPETVVSLPVAVTVST